jgi:DNA transposition AAA+ family ATPase
MSHLTFTQEEKAAIGDLLLERFRLSGFSSKGKYAVTIGLTGADMTNIENKKYLDNPQLVGMSKWINIARTLGYQKNERMKWVAANTVVSNYIAQQLTACQAYSMTAILVDEAGIGKTFTAKEYAKRTPNVIYIDCSVYPKKTDFIRAFATQVGISDDAKLSELMESALYAVSQMHNPLIILDEAGDLEHTTLLLIKRMYNALEECCGFYLIGADGLKRKIENGIKYQKLGFVEVFSRFGKKFSKILPELMDEKRQVLKTMAKEIAIANGITDTDIISDIIRNLFTAGFGDMRKVKREIIKLKV